MGRHAESSVHGWAASRHRFADQSEAQPFRIQHSGTRRGHQQLFRIVRTCAASQCGIKTLQGLMSAFQSRVPQLCLAFVIVANGTRPFPRDENRAAGPSVGMHRYSLGLHLFCDGDAESVHNLASGPFAQLPHSGAIATWLSICGATMRQSYRDIAMVILVGPLLAVVAAIALGKAFGSF